MDNTTIISMAVFIFTNIGTIIMMFLWIRSEANADRREISENLCELRSETNDLINAIHQDMKDFHTKLALQDQEFKMRLCAIEERSRK